MQIIPTVVILLFVIAGISSSLLTMSVTDRLEVRHYLARHRAELDLEKKIVSKRFDSFKKKTKSTGERKNAVDKKKKSPELGHVFPPISLAMLLESTPNQSFKQFCTAYFCELYSPLSIEGKSLSEKALRLFFEQCIHNAKTAKMAKKKLEWPLLIEDSPLKDKLLFGTTHIDSILRQGYPSIEKTFSFSSQKTAIPFFGLSERGKQLLLGKQGYQRYLALLQSRSNEGSLPTKDEICELFSSNELIHFCSFEKGKNTLRGEDGRALIYLE